MTRWVFLVLAFLLFAVPVAANGRVGHRLHAPGEDGWQVDDHQRPLAEPSAEK